MKSPEQQSVMVLHRTRSILIRPRIQISNAIRSHMAEFGMAAAVGRQGLHSLIEVFTIRLTSVFRSRLEDVSPCWLRSFSWRTSKSWRPTD